MGRKGRGGCKRDAAQAVWSHLVGYDFPTGPMGTIYLTRPCMNLRSRCCGWDGREWCLHRSDMRVRDGTRVDRLP